MSHIPYGSAAAPPWSVAIDPESAKWTFCGLRVLDVQGEPIEFETGGDEQLVVPLSGSCLVECDGMRMSLGGRESVFDGPTDFAYLPIGTQARIVGYGRFALPAARATRRLPARYGPAQDVPIEVRGGGAATRTLRNFCAPDAFECDRLMAVEVITPGGNWSSYPPHKHDTPDGQEAVLEEIYYFEGGPGVQQVYGTHEVLAQVEAGDVVLVPHGYHGPSMAMPGYDLYYLNVLAGPGEERSMAFSDDPRHAWIRGTW
ncbi:5-deoxy-glucuronate isomerase [Streptosporangiaceae bacterium NEAU-GS5]|nr:5-deoxy-glucuronate isomerase [Streptosporangiaceae bacterium NEAU-GS5]